ncbi:MAG: hypothetical protein AMK69_06080 [Nitrospira bacterium SG8_3]|nr:MAG: hypothetical protein AMK69_06080 [Nitrospira bacterium SG8_3]
MNQGRYGFLSGSMSPELQHYFNPLHIYCRLRDLGLPKSIAIYLSRFYERVIFKYLWPENED